MVVARARMSMSYSLTLEKSKVIAHRRTLAFAYDIMHHALWCACPQFGGRRYGASRGYEMENEED